MTVTINLKPDEAARLKDLAEGQGIEAQECARRIIEERLGTVNRCADEPPLSRAEIGRRLRAAGVRPGNRERAQALLRAWSRADGDPEGTVEEWDAIQRNIDRGTIDLRRVTL